MPHEIAIDTVVLRKANVPLNQDRSQAARMVRRLGLLTRIQRKEVAVLISQSLLREYQRQVVSPMNEFVRVFLELLTTPDGTHVIANWKTPWSHDVRAQARACRFPIEDDHVLRTAIRGHRTAIYTEEERMLLVDACIYRAFRVHIWEPQ